MKSKTGQSHFPVARAIGRTQSDLVAGIRRGEDYGEQLELFRDVLTPRARLQIYGMMRLAAGNPDKRIYAKIIDIGRAMGYAPTAKTGQLPSNIFQDIEDIGIRLRRKEVSLYFREPAGFDKTGRRKYRTGIMNLSVLQTFSFYYEDEAGHPIDLNKIPEDHLIKYEAIDNGEPMFAIPELDDDGQPIKNKDGSIRRHRANGVFWRFNSDIAEMMMKKETAWIMDAESLEILSKYVGHPSAFRIMEMSFFWKDDKQIEMGHEALVAQLGITSKDQDQVERAIDAAFKAASDEGVIDPVQIRPAGYYKKTKKTGKERRKGMVYQWRLKKSWRTAEALPDIPVNVVETGKKDGTTE